LQHQIKIKAPQVQQPLTGLRALQGGAYEGR
jgi:hypothetical protein